MIPGFLNIIQPADVRDGLDPEQWRAQVILVETSSREDSLQMICDGNEGYRHSQ